MSNSFKEGNAGGISFSTPAFSFGNTTPAVNSGFAFDLPMATIQSFSDRALTFTSNNADNNRGFIGGVLAKSQSGVTSTADAAFGYQTRALNTIDSVNAGITQNASKALSNQKKGFCFITTAICGDSGKPDNCDELETLRGFRDAYLIPCPDTAALVSLYYETAPGIVAAIDSRQDAAQVYGILRTAYLLPAVAAVKRGDYQAAFTLYAELCDAAALFALEA